MSVFRRGLRAARGVLPTPRDGAHERTPVVADAAADLHVRRPEDVVAAVDPAMAAEMDDYREAIVDLCDGRTDPESLAALFDRVQRRWRAREDRTHPGRLLELFGVALGDLTAVHAAREGTELRWGVLERATGTEPVLRLAGDAVLLLPVSAVHRRWDGAPAGWLADHAVDLAAAAVRSHPRVSQPS